MPMHHDSKKTFERDEQFSRGCISPVYTMEIWQIRERQPKSLSILCGETFAADIPCTRWAIRGCQKTLDVFPLLLKHAG